MARQAEQARPARIERPLELAIRLCISEAFADVRVQNVAPGGADAIGITKEQTAEPIAIQSDHGNPGIGRRAVVACAVGSVQALCS